MSEKEEKEEAGETRMQEIENELKDLKLKCSDLEAELKKEKLEVLAAKELISLDTTQEIHLSFSDHVPNLEEPPSRSRSNPNPATDPRRSDTRSAHSRDASSRDRPHPRPDRRQQPSDHLSSKSQPF
uniref:Uncharacterized protein n=1 Tax=Brassica oleracea var. oleracea TaxID=109376 RepID=A0A0D2ZQP3_BRAOL